MSSDSDSNNQEVPAHSSSYDEQGLVPRRERRIHLSKQISDVGVH